MGRARAWEGLCQGIELEEGLLWKDGNVGSGIRRIDECGVEEGYVRLWTTKGDQRQGKEATKKIKKGRLLGRDGGGLM